MMVLGVHVMTPRGVHVMVLGVHVLTPRGVHVMTPWVIGWTSWHIE